VPEAPGVEAEPVPALAEVAVQVQPAEVYVDGQADLAQLVAARAVSVQDFPEEGDLRVAVMAEAVAVRTATAKAQQMSPSLLHR
jgi:hypothetical protein